MQFRMNHSANTPSLPPRKGASTRCFATVVRRTRGTHDLAHGELGRRMRAAVVRKRPDPSDRAHPVKGVVAEHREEDVGPAARETEKGLRVVLALLDLLVVGLRPV